jgi:hypothetical protein
MGKIGGGVGGKTDNTEIAKLVPRKQLSPILQQQSVKNKNKSSSNQLIHTRQHFVPS